MLYVGVGNVIFLWSSQGGVFAEDKIFRFLVKTNRFWWWSLPKEGDQIDVNPF